MRTGNPTLNDRAFQAIPAAAGGAVMTLQGVVNRSFLLLCVLLMSSSWVWGLAAGERRAELPGYIMVGAIGGLIAALVTVFKKDWSPVSATVYALFEGFVLGGVSALAEMRYPGIVIHAVGLTIGTFVVLLFAYKSRLIPVTQNFRLGIVAATGAVALVYVVDIVLAVFGWRVPFIHEAGPLGIGISVVIVVIAALNLVLDFDFIERGSQARLPKYMAWYAAFGLLVTLVWLYLEILRLLSKMNSRR